MKLDYKKLSGKLLGMLKELKYDSLTGYITRNYFDKVLFSNVERMIGRNGGTLIFFDLNGLKAYNSKCGYKCGDEYLKRVSSEVLSQVEEELERRGLITTVYPIRQGGDEFLIIVNKVGLYAPYESIDFTFAKKVLEPGELNTYEGGLKEVIAELGGKVLYLKKQRH